MVIFAGDDVLRKWLATLDTYANNTYGRSVSSAVVDGTCVSCGRPAGPFTTESAAAQYPKVGLCEACQNLQNSKGETILPFMRTARAKNK